MKTQPPSGTPAPAAPAARTRRMYTVQETADMLGLSAPHVRRLIWRKELAAKKIGGAVRIPAAEIDRLATI